MQYLVTAPAADAACASHRNGVLHFFPLVDKVNTWTPNGFLSKKFDWQRIFVPNEMMK